MADRLGCLATYDTHYLVLAEYLACEFWTADERLANAVRGELPWVRWLGEV
jgi:predicted nucleic acid-binding protein